jgi:hypothetical protein
LGSIRASGFTSATNLSCSPEKVTIAMPRVRSMWQAGVQVMFPIGSGSFRNLFSWAVTLSVLVERARLIARSNATTAL